MNWILIMVGAIFLVCVVVGIWKGAVKIAVSLATTIVTVILVFFLTPYARDAVIRFTPLDEIVEDRAETAMNEVISMVLQGQTEDSLMSVKEEKVRKALAAAGVEEEELSAAGITVQDIVNRKVSGEELAKHGISSGILKGLYNEEPQDQDGEQTEDVLPRDVQIRAIETSKLPDFFKDLLLENNNSDKYLELGAETFTQYAAGYLSRLLIQIAAFLLTFVLVTFILRAIIFALNIVTELPVLGLANRLAGGAAGALGALLIVWIIFVGLTLLYQTAVGDMIFGQIQKSAFLEFLYQHIMKIATIMK